ncbi:inactive rhomboid protein 1 isoform X3 [Cryptotermes secundus]|uniref:inactive rhomboid protein 1 isoform X3 n=1 Tax=Cryptotermes secundus TaxID=105785 RepID=UPI001454CC18|nr:inactive rhomboid protein 1 isoform X3 [Cryptotermes secundus]
MVYIVPGCANRVWDLSNGLVQVKCPERKAVPSPPSDAEAQPASPHRRAVGQGQQQGLAPAPTGTLNGSSSQQQDPTPEPSAPEPCTSGPQHAGPQGASVPLERSISAPASTFHSMGSRPARQARPPLGRSLSRTEMVKNYIKRETAAFFGVEESSEEEQQARWLDRRKRLAIRKYGSLKEEYLSPATSPRPRRQHQLTSAYATQTRDTLATGRPDVLPGGRESLDASGGHVATTPQHWAEPPVRRKESVARMTFGGLAYTLAALTRHLPRRATARQFSRSYPSPTVAPSLGPSTPITDDEVFFTAPVGAAAVPVVETSLSMADQPERPVEHVALVTTDAGFMHAREQYPRSSNWRRPPLEPSDSGPEVGCSRIWSRVLDRVFDNSNRRLYGMGVAGRIFRRSVKHSVANTKAVQEQLDDIEDHRPFFTYWVTTVQVLILIISLTCYGLGPIGIHLNHRSGQVLVTSLSLQQVDYQEPANFWIGPRAADLIHLGAKFAPCMRKDAKIIKEIEKGREKERETACCIRNDDSGCVQSSQADCSVRGLRPTKIISTWKKWSAGDSGPGGRISGSVCGLDPKFCEAPASVAPYEWPDDITKWPICRKTNYVSQEGVRNKDKTAEHMVCEVIGHPCCIGIHGMCRITTKEYCDFVRGYFHEEASLCSQVSCLDDVCGMIPFYSPEVPDQFYRLWTSLFLHAGICQLLLTLVIQYIFMRDLEKLTGSLRIAIIYMGSGVAGNLASAIFVPYRADVGPSGSQFGLLACLIVEVLNVWPMLKHPKRALLKLMASTLVLLLFGLLPWIDNYAHLFGFIFGFLLSYALMPYVSFGPYDRHKKIVLIWVCLLFSFFLFAILVVLFYVIPVYDCEVCNIFNCIPLTRDFCASQNINFKREEPVV